ncbi:MAG: hypothetical protein IJ893_02815 [Bacteroidales bacterium]|nr:hypothetical protein [Bacteroidales bacterium]
MTLIDRRNNMSVFGIACKALDEHIPVRIELDNGDVYPHEEVVKVDYNGGEAFWVKLSEEGAKIDPEEDKPGDIVGFGVDGVKIELVTD